MTRYLLSCQCGKNVPVDVGQAGGQVACTACGSSLDVPQLRKLRHLPIEQAAATEHPRGTSASTSGWGARQGLIAASLIIAAILSLAALWNRLNEPEIPEFKPETRLAQVREGIERMTPVQGWQLWVELYRPLAQRGFAVIEDPHKPAVEQYVAQRRFLQMTFLASAAVFATVAITAALWPKPSPKRSRV